MKAHLLDIRNLNLQPFLNFHVFGGSDLTLASLLSQQLI